MTVLQAIVLGIVQGLTEFLPVSSSAHLAIVPWLAGWRLDPRAAFVFDVLVQLGTLVPLVLVFWKDLLGIARALVRALAGRDRPWSTEARLGAWVALATLPAAVAGLLIKDQVEAAFSDVRAVFFFMIGTALILAVGERLGRGARRAAEVSLVDTVIIGVAQAIALFPGISRSGATISAGRARGLARAEAARFSFLMAIPALTGAGVIAGRDLLTISGFGSWILPIAVGFVAAAIVGYVAIRWLLSYLNRGSLYPFAMYCLVVGVLGSLLVSLRG